MLPRTRVTTDLPALKAASPVDLAAFAMLPKADPVESLAASAVCRA